MITIAMTAGELWIKDAMVTQLTNACWAALAINRLLTVKWSSRTISCDCGLESTPLSGCLESWIIISNRIYCNFKTNT